MQPQHHGNSLQVPVPTLSTTRLVIRPIQEADLPAVQRNFEDYETVRFLNAAIPWPYPPDGAQTWYRERVAPRQGLEAWTWAICLKESPQDLIGVIEIFREGRPSHRGFWLDRRFWKQGYMSEAVAAVNDCAFDQLGFKVLILDNAVGNAASARIKGKSGARFLGMFPGQFVDPGVTEIEHWELTREAWKKASNQYISSQQLNNR